MFYLNRNIFRKPIQRQPIQIPTPALPDTSILKKNLEEEEEIKRKNDIEESKRRLYNMP